MLKEHLMFNHIPKTLLKLWEAYCNEEKHLVSQFAEHIPKPH